MSNLKQRIKRIEENQEAQQSIEGVVVIYDPASGRIIAGGDKLETAKVVIQLPDNGRDDVIVNPLRKGV